jgi:hypothetical protein
MRSIEPSRLLRFAFGLDAAGTAAVAAVQLAALEHMSALLNLPQALLLESGVFMAAYAALLLGLMRAQRLWRALVVFIVVGNGLWALGCLGTLAAVSPNAWGLAWLLFQATAVLLFAGLQAAGLKHSAPPAANQAVHTLA